MAYSEVQVRIITIFLVFLTTVSAATATSHSESGHTPPESRHTPFSLKTNLLYDAALCPSIEAEYVFAPHWSVNAEYSIAWWSRKADHKYYQLMQFSPEIRYWINPDRKWHGHYFGVFAGAGLYDLENGKEGYQGEFLTAGLSYGYMFPIGKKLSLEAGLGLGWLHTQYDEYIPYEDHYVYVRRIRTNYLGPVKVKLAIVWHLGKKDRKGTE